MKVAQTVPILRQDDGTAAFVFAAAVCIWNGAPRRITSQSSIKNASVALS